jgi:hypothetical protein
MDMKTIRLRSLLTVRRTSVKRSVARPLLGPVVLAALLLVFSGLAKAGIPEPDLVWYGKVLTSSGGGTVRVTTGTLVWQIQPLAGGPAIIRTTELTNINDQFSFVLRVPCETPEPGVTASTNVVNLRNPAAQYGRLTVTLDGQLLSLISATGEFSPLPTHRGRTERIDLRLGIAPLDSDGDGLADAWELQHFGNLNANASGDPDADGMSNFREFRAGTNPTDAQSRFELVEIAKAPNGMAIRWSSQPGRSYRVLRASSILAASGDYQVVQAGLAATPPINQFTDTTVATGAQFFYLIEVE